MKRRIWLSPRVKGDFSYILKVVDVRESIDKCLREENIWPILQKGYSSIKKVIQATKISKEIFEIKDLKPIINFTKNYSFSDLDLDHLYSNIDELSWLIDLNFRGLKLAKRLGVSNFEDFKSDILRGYFRNIGNISILTSKKNEWLTKFYLWVDDNFSDYEFQSWHIIKTNTAFF